MITKKDLNIYRKFDGDVDRWQRQTTSSEDNNIDWILIDSLIQDIRLSKKGMAAKEYETALYEKLRQVCDSDETIHELEKLAAQHNISYQSWIRRIKLFFKNI